MDAKIIFDNKDDNLSKASREKTMEYCYYNEISTSDVYDENVWRPELDQLIIDLKPKYR